VTNQNYNGRYNAQRRWDTMELIGMAVLLLIVKGFGVMITSW